ncbi:MAG: SO_0444 family Cu/Zn efflux transporter [Chlorobiaceae bacterium]|nr:SO_0444 family Cu/Zn efflux transporter [Chlorobiaceae bacterium]
MNETIDIVNSVFLASWKVLLDSAPFVLLGFFMSGLLKAFLPDNFVARHLSGRGIGSVLKAALLGVPIPLCSCGVLPAAAGLKKQGAGKGALASFLISTPETGKDAIAVTYALLDPLMTIIRPVVAVLMAIVTGISVSFFEEDKKNPAHPEGSGVAPDMEACGSSCCGSVHETHGKRTAGEKFRDGMSFAFGDLLKDVAGWLFIGILISGLISVFVSEEMVTRYLSNDYLAMVLMFLLSVPLYVCATSSTPIVAALALKGISPGAALVFLLAGPATNAASLPVISKILGRKATVAYLVSIVLFSLAAGVFVNHLYGFLGMDVRNWVSHVKHEDGGVLEIASSIVLIMLVVKSYMPSKQPHSCCTEAHEHHGGHHEHGHAHSHEKGTHEDHAHCGCGK